MQKYKLLFLLLLILSCRYKKFSKAWEVPPIPNSGSSFFSYGEKPQEVETSLEKPPEWGPHLKISEDSICLNSHDDFFLSKEYGPSLGVCVEKTQDNQSLLESALATLNELDETKIRPDGFLIHDGLKAHLHFLSITEIVNEISGASSRTLFLGDNRLHTALAKRMDLSFEIHKSILGENPNRIETSFSLPYFSIYSIDGIYKIVFPPVDSGIPRSQFHYLVLEITNLPGFLSKYKPIFENIQRINDEWKTNCSIEKLEFTEVLGYASGSTKRFLEWTGSRQNTSCINNLSLSIAGKKYNLDTGISFLFPGAVKLFIEEDSLLQGIVLKDANWKDIKSSSILQLDSSELSDLWQLPENVNFNWAEEEFSLKKKPISCEWTSSIIRNSKLCGDPGIDLDTASPAVIGIDSCKPEDFTLTELNAYGIRQESKIDKSGKFIELIYKGVNDCKLSSLALVAGTVSIPLDGLNTLIKQNSYLLISDTKHFTGIKNIIPRNIDFLQWQNSIAIRNSLTSKILWEGLKPEEVFLSESMNKNIFSMILNQGKVTHHPEQVSTYLQAQYRSAHIMSPGEANLSKPNDASGEISEILWAGGYKNYTSIPDEKFVELKTKGSGTLGLEIYSGTKTSVFYIPITGINPFTVISKTALQCFPNSSSIETDKLSLPDEITNLKLTRDDSVLSEIKYNPLKGQGASNSTLKLKSSFANSGIVNAWTTSTKPHHIIIAPDCLDQVYATPGSLNEFEPFLVDQGFDYSGTGLFHLAASYFDENYPYQVKLYSYLPQETSIITLQKNPPSSLLGAIENTLSANGLVYQKLENYSDLKIYNRDGIYIEGVMTNPSNSQNEWILFCNRGKLSRDLIDYEIQDRDGTDRFETYQKRKAMILPSGLSPGSFIGNSSILSVGQCAYLVDPDSYAINLKQIGIAPTLVLTVKTSSTIGNGISSGEALDLFKYIGSQRIHVHSFGNYYSHSPFSIPVMTDEIILLSSSKKGESRYDYEVLKW